jgi:multiple sugar transport system substrate-binding protein
MSANITRRRLLTTSAMGAALLASGHGTRALAQAAQPEQDLPVGAAGKLTVIHRTEYFAAAQDAFRDICENFAQENGVALDISTTNPEAFGDFLGKMAAAVRAGNPPDLAYTSNVSIKQMNLLGLLEDVNDVVEEAIALHGNIVPGINAEADGKVNGRWVAVPFLAGSTGNFIRGDKLKEHGIDPASLVTWNDRREAALAISDPENEFWGWGITPNQSGDGYGALTMMLHAFGGSFTDETGMKVVFNSPETVEAMRWIAETYDRDGKYARMLPPGIESWGDSSNNEAYLAGRIGYTHNSYSVYAQARRDENPVFGNTLLLTMPKANNGDSRDGGQVLGWLTVFKGAPNVDLAKKLALALLQPENFNQMSTIAGGLFMPAYEGLWTEELLATDPNFRIIKEQVSVTEPHLVFSWPAQPNAAIDAIRPQGILEQAVGNVLAKRMTPEEAVEDAHNKIVQIFEEGGIPQD